MGNTSVTRHYPTYPRDILEQKIEEHRQEDTREYGSDYYSGSWGQKAMGVNIRSSVYQSIEEANSYIISDSTCGDMVSCVRVQIGAGNRIGGGGCWVPTLEKGSLSTEKIDKKTEMLQRKKEELSILRNERNTRLAGYLSARKEKRNTVTCHKCKKTHPIEDLGVSKRCPHCNAEYFYLSQTEYKSISILSGKIAKLISDISKREKAEEKRMVSPLSKIEAKISKLEKTRNDVKNKLSTSVKKSGFITCSDCKSKINLSKLCTPWSSEDRKVNYFSCPVCQRDSLQSKNNEVLERKEWVLRNDLIPLYKQRSELKGEWYLVGGHCKT